ncbi:amidohydrolase family protein [Mesorhizobium sp. ES1-1]|uniref:amidohydrolase family protein n=1 Tax=Mesorhizobium sp. ES1-1 TaxID=2876629 RepID=UPI001CCC6550|nr:amidohydrolase [Mesorhizobium sp. ES1-1]MBZ9674276.1 amidohydrolase [Mesorhizobium sp. ES1-1]
MIIDTHLHLIDRSALRYPWLAGVPAINRDFSYEEYAAEAKRVGVERVLHMEVDVDPADIEAETARVESQSRQPGSMLAGAIASCRPEEANFPAYLDRQRANPFVKGFRRVLHVVPDDVSEGGLFRENIKRLSGTGLVFDLVVLPHQIPKAIALVDLAPDVMFVLDHCGVPDIKSGAEHPWRAHMSEIARRPNVAAKVSGVVAYAGPDWTVETLRPYVEHTIGAFGWDRVVWGSDWPVCTLGGGLSTWVAATQALLTGCGDSERDRLLRSNAVKLWRLE